MNINHYKTEKIKITLKKVIYTTFKNKHFNFYNY